MKTKVTFIFYFIYLVHEVKEARYQSHIRYDPFNIQEYPEEAHHKDRRWIGNCQELGNEKQGVTANG